MEDKKPAKAASKPAIVTKEQLKKSFDNPVTILMIDVA
jgi:hypothetical protein